MIYDTGNLSEGDRLEVERGENCVIYNLSNAGGTGKITQYDVYDSVNVLYSDLHLTRFGEGSYGEKYLMIEHCREGRFEAEFEGGRRFYMGAGDVCVHNVDYAEMVSASMPVRHYHGITIILRTEGDKSLEKMLDFVGVDVKALAERVRGLGGIALIRLNERTAHIFDEFYRVSGENRSGCLKLKVPEVLLFLSGEDLGKERVRLRLMSREVSELLKTAELYIWENLEKPLTIDKLSALCNMSGTSFKNNFKLLYGCPVHAYINTVRMQVAAYRLVGTEEKISVIAQGVGFKTENKFAARFAKFYGKTPGQYRRNNVLSDLTVNAPVRLH